MDVGLGIAGFTSVALALAHESLGVFFVLPIVREQPLGPIPFGSERMTLATVLASWHLITVFVLSMGIVLIVLAASPDTDPRMVVLRVFGVMWFVATVVALSVGLRGIRRFRDIFRLPVPVFFLLVSILCLEASL